MPLKKLLLLAMTLIALSAANAKSTSLANFQKSTANFNSVVTILIFETTTKRVGVEKTDIR